ncbi:MAG: FAD:protein FMN transferase [Dechloromonas sp.]|uniref:FAD:protein FMN transferase n=1 Tax=Candidatus Dechloromonas phosphorivorans TaxID=2899244 RepID=A0A935K782_9RHOO|nr:FAD:protein FMN transferase [Candidatus Dechloromonas phosphorivorans]
MHRAYHAWQESELTALNLAIFEGRPQQVSEELANLILESQELAKQGQYLFDPGIGQLVKLWGFHSDEFKAVLPPEVELKRLIAAHPSIKDLSQNGNIVTSLNKAVSLDFGGYLKGVALARAANILRQQGIHNALINIGGNVNGSGQQGRPSLAGWYSAPPAKRPHWPLLSWLMAEHWHIGRLPAFLRTDGKRYPHLLTHAPVIRQATQAVTILIPAGPKAGTLSDAASKPVFIAGPEHWQELANLLGLEQVIRVAADGQIFVTEKLAKRLKYTGAKPELTVVP